MLHQIYGRSTLQSKFTAVLHSNMNFWRAARDHGLVILVRGKGRLRGPRLPRLRQGQFIIIRLQCVKFRTVQKKKNLNLNPKLFLSRSSELVLFEFEFEFVLINRSALGIVLCGFLRGRCLLRARYSCIGFKVWCIGFQCPRSETHRVEGVRSDADRL